MIAWALAGILLLQDDAAKGEAAYRAGNYAEAAALLLKAAEASPKSGAGWTAAGHACLQAGRFEDAARCYRIAEPLSPGKAEVCRGLGQALYRWGRPAEAEAPLRRAAALEPGGPECLWLARVRLDLGDPEGAESELRGAPATGEALELRAYAQARAGRHSEAAGTLRRLAILQPREARHRRALGQEEAAAGRPGEAVDALEAARRLGDRDPGMHRLLGDLYIRLHMPREAAAAYGRVPDPTAEDRHRLGTARWAAGEAAGAREALEAAGPGHAPSVLLLAKIVSAGSDAQAGRKACAAALAVSPATPEPALWLADLESRAGNWAEAAAAYAEAEKRGDSRPAIAYHRIRALERAGSGPAAGAALREALRLHPLDETLRSLARERCDKGGL